MYPSSNSCNYSLNISSSNNLFHIPSPNSMQYEHELFQYFHDHHLLQPQQQQQQQLLTTPDHYIAADSNKDTIISSTNQDPEKVELQGNCKNKKGDNKRVVAYKKDRHSKINTARGPRDRRMRLSLDVARKFFNLQDLLGFDKASKTVEWLLTKSKSAVNELVQGINKENYSTANIGAISTSSTSECEVVSGIYESTTNIDIPKQQQQSNRGKVGEKKKANKIVRRAAFNPVAKESRKQARARARERTKIKKSFLNTGDQSMAADELKRLGCWSPFERGEESGIQGYSTDRQVEDQHTTHHEEHLLGTKENVDDCNLVVTGNWNPYTIFSYHHNTEISHEQQFTNFQFSGKFWEA